MHANRQHSALKRTMVATMKTSNRCVRLAGAVAVLFSASVLASSSYSSGSSQQCTPGMTGRHSVGWVVTHVTTEKVDEEGNILLAVSRC